MNNQKNSRSEQARINGAKSRGPATAEGRRKMADSKRKHGYYAKSVTVLDVESDAAIAHAELRRLHPVPAFGITQEMLQTQDLHPGLSLQPTQEGPKEGAK